MTNVDKLNHRPHNDKSNGNGSHYDKCSQITDKLRHYKHKSGDNIM